MILRKFGRQEVGFQISIDLKKDWFAFPPVDKKILSEGLRSKQKKIEDSIQIYCATNIEKIDCNATRNSKDFKGSKILVLAPDELCSKL